MAVSAEIDDVIGHLFSFVWVSITVTLVYLIHSFYSVHTKRQMIICNCDSPSIRMTICDAYHPRLDEQVPLLPIEFKTGCRKLLPDEDE